MSEYEEQRMKRIEENNARLNEMGLKKKASSYKAQYLISKNKKRKGERKRGLENDEQYIPLAAEMELSFSSGSDSEVEFSASQRKGKMTSRCSRGGRRGGRGGHHGEDGRFTDPIPSRSSNELDPFSPNLVINANQSQGLEKEVGNDTVIETEEVGDGMIMTKRGITCGKGARKAMKASKTRLPLEFNFQSRRVICGNDSAFMHECGYILRNNCSLQYKEWRHVPNEVRLSLRHKLTTLFDIDVENSNVRKLIDSYMARAWRGYRAKLRDYFKDIKGSENLTRAKKTPPSDVDKDDWEYLCDIWSETKYKENAKKKAEARGKRKLDTRNGSKSTIRYHIERGLDLDSSSGQLETWRLTHWDAEKGWISLEAAAKYEDMMKLRNQHSVESMSDKLIIENVLGRSSVRLHGWGRDPVSAGSTPGTTQKSKRLTYEELVDALEAVKDKCATMEQTLIEHNILPPPSNILGTSQGDTSEHGENSDG